MGKKAKPLVVDEKHMESLLQEARQWVKSTELLRQRQAGQAVVDYCEILLRQFHAAIDNAQDAKVSLNELVRRAIFVTHLQLLRDIEDDLNGVRGVVAHKPLEGPDSVKLQSLLEKIPEIRSHLQEYALVRKQRRASLTRVGQLFDQAIEEGETVQYSIVSLAEKDRLEVLVGRAKAIMGQDSEEFTADEIQVLVDLTALTATGRMLEELAKQDQQIQSLNEEIDEQGDQIYEMERRLAHAEELPLWGRNAPGYDLSSNPRRP